jgi:hypothetical protein
MLPNAHAMRDRLSSTSSQAVIIQGSGARCFFRWCLDEYGGGWDEPWDEEKYDGNQVQRVETHPLYLREDDTDDSIRLGILGVTHVPSADVAVVLIDRFMHRILTGAVPNQMTTIWLILEENVTATHAAAHHELITDAIRKELQDDGYFTVDSDDDSADSIDSDDSDVESEDFDGGEVMPETIFDVEDGSEDRSEDGF